MERADLLAGTMSPAVENTLPLETKVAGTASYFQWKSRPAVDFIGLGYSDDG